MNTPNTTTAIAEYSPTAAALADLEARMGKVVYDVSTPAGMAAAKKDRAEVRDLRVALEKKRVEIKAPALKRCNEIDTEAKRITAELLKYETPPDQAIKAHEAKIEAERQAKVLAEQQRVLAIEARINDLRYMQQRAAVAINSAEVAKLMEKVDATVIDEKFGEQQDLAADVKAEVYAQLKKMHDAAVEREAEAQRLAAERAELERQRQEQEAALAAERKKIADQEAETRKVREAEEARQRAENERIAAENRAEAERIRKAGEELAAAQRAEQERKDREEWERSQAAAAAQHEAEARAEAQRKAEFVPTLEQVVEVLADHFEVTNDRVLEWLDKLANPMCKVA